MPYAIFCDIRLERFAAAAGSIYYVPRNRPKLLRISIMCSYADSWQKNVVDSTLCSGPASSSFDLYFIGNIIVYMIPMNFTIIQDKEL